VAYCIFTGDDTRLMMNAQKSRVKLSALEKMLNRLVVGMVLVELSICVAVAVM
jgi:phospholipid-transporting ATPase